MKIQTKYFAFMRERLGKSSEEFELPERSTISDFIQAFRTKYGSKVEDFFSGAGLRLGFTVALNGENVDVKSWESTFLKEGDVVVIIPPIAGGYLKLGKRTPLWP